MIQSTKIEINDDIVRCDLCKIATVQNSFPSGEPFGQTLPAELMHLAVGAGWIKLIHGDKLLDVCPTCQAVARALQIANRKADEKERAEDRVVRCPCAVWFSDGNRNCTLPAGHSGAHETLIANHAFTSLTGSPFCELIVSTPEIMPHPCGYRREAHAS